MLKLKQFRDETRGLSDLLNYGAVVEDGVILCKDGSLLGGWYYHGEDLESSTPEELNTLSARLNAALSKFGNGWMLQIDAIRRAADSYPMPERAFPDAVNQSIDDERRTIFKSAQTQFETIYALIVTYLPPLSSESKFYTFLIDEPEEAKAKNLAEKHLQYFEQSLASLEADLSSILRLRRMRSEGFQCPRSEEGIYDHLLQYVNFAVTGERHPIQLPSCPMYIDALLGWKDLEGGLRPKIGDKYISTISIDGFPQDSYPSILGQLDQLSLEYRWHTRFIFMDRQKAISELKSYRKKWSQKVRGFVDQILQTNRGPVDQNALYMVGELDEALSISESGLAAFGYYTSLIVLLNEEREKLEEDSKDIVRVIQDLGFSCRRESLNSIEAWLGSLPSHALQNVRRPLMHTLNLADLLPVTSVWSGEAQCPSPKFPRGSAPLIQAFTGGNTAFRLNVHVGDVGHFLILGPSGAGKSTLLALIASQFRRYEGAKVFAFDKGYSLFPLTMGSDGNHFDIAGEEEGSKLQFCPLANIASSQAEQTWAEEWIESLCGYQDFKVLPHHKNAIHRAMELLKFSHSKTLTDFLATLQDKEIRAVLQHYTLNGSMGYLLDAEKDSLELSSFQVFEIEHLMNLGDKNALPVLTYIFHRIELELDGSPGLLLLDEAWIALQHPVFREKIKEWLKVFRKANVAVGLATQSISDAARSGILDVIAETCQTKFFLANPSATDESSREFYRSLGLNPRQIEIIGSLTPKRDYYVVSPNGKRSFQLGLGPVSLRWLGVSGKEDIQKLKNLITDCPQTWNQIWEKESLK